jgi:hypothetical protein
MLSSIGNDGGIRGCLRIKRRRLGTRCEAHSAAAAEARSSRGLRLPLVRDRSACRRRASLGRGDFFPSSNPRDVFDELRLASEVVQPTTRASRTNGFAATDGLFWPCPDLTHPGTPRLFIERFPTPSGRARFHAVHHDAPAEAADEHYPLYLTTGRLLAQYQSGTQTRPIAELQPLAPTAFAEVHPATAARLGLSSGGEIALTTRRGTTQLPGRVTPSIREDTVFVPFHWGGAQSIHRLTNPVLDPISRMPEFKVCAVEAQTVATARPGHDRLPTEEPVRVCDCNGVTRARIVEAVLAGARSLQSVRCHQGRHRLRLVPAGGAGGDRCDVQPAGYDGQPHPSGPSAGSGPEGCGRRSERLGEAIAGRRRQRHGRCGLPGWSRPVAVTWPNLAFR